MELETITIEVDEVKSGKVNIISFYRKGQLIDRPPLQAKLKSEEYHYHYRHHLDGDDLERLNTRFPTIFPFDDRKSINDWADEMKREFQRLISDGRLDRQVEKDGIIYEIRLVWVRK
ncbi:hypothetical protein BKP35_16670 [Anaerobacillus arseniciselenatis]|uniref:Uncharacterized protein n=1 Tax=Anaerobacillus arseniciselenatis TaxID=85682 RepID=A0A1S2LAF6_9BACI|nr:hypothetical protein [Anaerobacillus arseniciselenatis]OIJ09304.1 hypothetical protein BKP35_16670 [Anaerobacillus arseniciselenatis]